MPRKTNFVNPSGKSYYRVTRTIDYDDDGYPIKKQFYGAGVNEANQKADEYKKNYKKNASLDSITLEDLMYKWLFQIKRNELKPSSFQSYEGTFRLRVQNSEIAKIKVSDVKGITLQEYYNKLR